MGVTYFPWIAVAIFAVLGLAVTKFAHRQAHQRRNQMQVVLFEEHFNRIAHDCYRCAKAMSEDTRRQFNLTITPMGDNEIFHFARVPGRMDQENYEIVYKNREVVRVCSRYGNTLDACSDKLNERASVVIKLHRILRDYCEKNPPGPD